MQLKVQNLSELAQELMAERKRQGLSREQTAAVCNVSESFIRDAESDPGRCSLAKLLQLTQGLGLTLMLTGWQIEGTTSDSHTNTKVSAS
ncbi:MAG: helix-turn-helix domain-containing protein [Polaromonas sp.]|uniref:helix-turn-helix domain-containing protein n=1 Tax=Polaromonas sp. TaxID=1869339 RepID=UPI002734E648|nr:helix-turn-helix domain-containing protein [Polaromonas sp.]MDP3799565.1 helix-turn-helix domain-containing protein [Polaromonas sp.]